MEPVIAWLLDGPPWVQYRTRVDLLHQPEDDPQTAAARRAMLAHPQVRAMLAELVAWPGPTLSNHKSAGHPLHKLTFAADLGLHAGDPEVDGVIVRVLEHQAADGPFQVLANYPVHFGGTGQNQWCWALCDTPLVLYALVKMGLGNDARVQAAAQHLASLVRDNGWPCAVSPDLGKFRGPGRKEDLCPYATLLMLKALAHLPTWRNQPASHTGAEALLALWAERRERHPYLFYMGTDFCKLKAPFVWYDVLHVADVLTHFDGLRREGRLQTMVELIRAAADQQGRYTAGSIWKAWQEWDFGQKRTPSHWLTLLAHRVLQRM